ncbi:MAG: TonB-dependent receptor [Woeseiaceae bacterium]|jgi:iron complex outermembrane receptor protein
MDFLQRSLAIGLGLVMGLSAFGVQAQEQELVFEEIIVTAQKREQSLQDVPISVSVVSGEKLTEAGIFTLDDLALYVPNFSKGESAIGPIIQIRGIATGANPAFEQSVVLYSDDVSLSRAPLARMPFMDLERVEVLRGPQNVLFGKNSIGGAISMISAKPTEDFEGSFSVRYEPDYEDSEVTGVISGSLNDSVRARLAARYADFGGYYENEALDRNEEQREETAVRLTLDFDVGDNAEASIKFEHDTVDSIGEGNELIFGYPNPNETIDFEVFPGIIVPVPNPFFGLDYTQTVAALQASYNFGLIPPNPFFPPPVDVGSDTIKQDRIRRTAYDGYQDLDMTNVVLTYNQDFDDFMFTSITSYVDYQEDRLGGGGLSGIDISSILTYEEYQQISQEIRFTSDTGGRFEWIAGGFFQSWDLQADESTLLDDMNLPVLLGITGGFAGLEAAAFLDSTRFFTSDSTTYAGFGQLTWNASDSTRVILGGRYTHEEKTARRVVDIVNQLTGEFDVTQAIVASCGFGVDYDTLGALSNSPIGGLLPDCNGNFVGPGVYSTHDTTGRRNEDAFTPSLTFEFDLGDSHLLYASASTGFKAGGFDARAPREKELQYEDEEVLGYELGLKSSLAGGRAQTNIAVFHSDYDDLQVSTFDGRAGFVVGNAAEYRAQGVEFDGRWRVTDHFTLSGAIAFIDSEFTDYENASCNEYLLLTGQVTFPCSRTGLPASNTPEWSANLIADLVLPLTGSMDFRATLDVIYEDEYFTESTKEIGTLQDAYTKFNLRVALEGDKWTLAVLGKNLSDEEVIEFSGPIALSGAELGAPTYFGFLQPPRTIAAQFEYRF